MGRVYAHEEDSGRRFLLRIECDGPGPDRIGCKAWIAPHPEISQSGWTKHGKIVHGTRFEYAYCPECS